jgi:hypothetical protein
MNRRNRLGTALVVLAVVLFVVPALFPVQAMLTHDTRHTVPPDPESIQENGFEIVGYENLSERGRELYVRTLENGGEYRVRQGQGAPGFEYPTREERRAALTGETDRSERPGSIVIKRPEDDSGLPEADEDRFGPPREEGENASERRELTMRYDAMRTFLEQPPLESPPQLARLVAALLAVLSLGVGGYLLSSK